jgi:hypothetical protein
MAVLGLLSRDLFELTEAADCWDGGGGLRVPELMERPRRPQHKLAACPGRPSKCNFSVAISLGLAHSARHGVYRGRVAAAGWVTGFRATVTRT